MAVGRPRLSRALLALVLVAGALATVLTVVPDARAGAKAAGLLLEALGTGAPRPLAADVERREVRLDGVTGDLYTTGGDAPPVLLLPGAAPDGRSDRRVVRLARAMARSDRTVLVPELSLFDAEIDLRDVDRVVRAVVALATRHDQQVVVLGFSFGGSLGMVAAADPRAAGSVRLVATFGSYVDLVGVVQAATTGTSVVAGRQVPWEVPDRAAEVVSGIAEGLVPPEQRAAFAAAVAAGGDPTGLAPEGAAVLALVTNRDPDRTRALAARLDPGARAVLAAHSPSDVAGRLRDVPVLAAHSRDDPAVPYAELLRVQEVLPHARTLTVQSFEHVDLDATGSVREVAGDVGTSWRFVRRVLAAQERWPLAGWPR